MFCDLVKIKIIAGKGGDGALSFLHEKDRPKGGPDGGDGGRGGNVIFQSDENINTLTDFLRKKKFQAPDGKKGMGNNQYGKDGEDLIIKVPLGTIVNEIQSDGTWKPLLDFSSKNQQEIISYGGKGGYGNAHFVSSVRQVPKFRQLGKSGESKKLVLELKTIAHIGLVGLPNSGKSTFLSTITKARPKIANYPFTTLEPHLGVVYQGKNNLIVADIPGLIAGASQGKGLGHKFLKHIERTKLLLHLMDIQSLDPVKDYFTIKKELSDYSLVLAKKPSIVCFTKLDTTGWKSNSKELKEYIKYFKQQIKNRSKIFAVSSSTHEGLKEIIDYIFINKKKYRI